MKYRKKPVVIEAFQFTGAICSVEHILDVGIPDWFIDAVLDKTVHTFSDHITIQTLEGVHRADIGDWIIQGVKGELYPCKPDIFAITYSEEI